MNTAFKDQNDNVGHKVRRIREIVGMKQGILAELCGWSQQQMSKLELSDQIDDELLTPIAHHLGVTPEFIKHFNEEKVIYNISHNHDRATANFQPTIHNPIEQVTALFERLLEKEQEKTELLSALSKTVVELAARVEQMGRP